MSRSWNKAWKITPRIDCGLCGVSTCAAFARAIGVGIVSLDACPIILLPEFKDQKSELEEYVKMSQSIRVRNAPELPEGGILLTRPCKDTDEKVMAEMRVYNGIEAGSPMYFSVFDPKTLCDLLECFSNRFDLVKCSRDLGYARADVDDSSITILQDGRINMRRITDYEHVTTMFNELERSVIGSIICNCCGVDLQSILTGFVKPVEEEHTVLTAGSTLILNKEIANQAITKKMLLSLEGDDIIAVVGALDILKDYLRSQIDKVPPMKLELGENYPNIKTIRCLLVNIISDKKYFSYETQFLKVLALVWAIEDAMIGLQEFEENLESVSPESKKNLLKFLSLARTGKLVTSEKIASELLIAYAHAARINRAMFLLEQWSS